MSEKQRLDKWLWYARFFKSRSLATSLCRAKKVRINGVHCSKASATIAVGDVLTFPKADQIKVIKVLDLGVRRGPAVEAALLYDDISPALKSSDQTLADSQNPSREKGMGRPTKTDRRALDKWQGQD